MRTGWEADVLPLNYTRKLRCNLPNVMLLPLPGNSAAALGERLANRLEPGCAPGSRTLPVVRVDVVPPSLAACPCG